MNTAETMSREVAPAPASKYPPQRRRQNDTLGTQGVFGKTPEQEIPSTSIAAQLPADPPQLMTPYALQIAAQLDKLERERTAAIEERNQGRARIEQFQHRQAELVREKEMLEIRIADQARIIETERSERIRLADAMESIIQLAQQKLAQPA